MVSSALAACGDVECPHTVVLATTEREVDTKQVCDRMAVLPGRMAVHYGVVGKDCADLCGDRKMNGCYVPAMYDGAYGELNKFPPTAPRACPPWDPTMTITCMHEEQRGKWDESCPIAGRRPAGLLASRGSGARSRANPRAHCEVADYLARAAHLEAASVLAFDKLAEDLARLGAPAELIEACLRAAREETGHARLTGKLARARQACPPGVDVLVRGSASLLELALENAVEGVVREAYGALQAGVSGRKARDQEIRAVMASIAEDEASHAFLALRLADWLDTQLSAEQRAQVAHAKRAAIHALRGELAHEPVVALRDEVGLSSRAQALALVEQLEQTVWCRSLAA
jgi:hypothetical protein